MSAVGVLCRGRGADNCSLLQLGHRQQHPQLHSGELHSPGHVTLPPCSVVGEQRLPVQGDYGPFQPNFPVKVPLWLAVMLHKRKKCRIRPPDWMQSEHLQGGT